MYNTCHVNDLQPTQSGQRHELPRNSEAKTATQQNYDTQNAKKHDPYNVPINGISISVSAMSAKLSNSSSPTIISNLERLPSPARRCSHAREVLGLLPSRLITLKTTQIGNFPPSYFATFPTELCLGCAQQQEWKSGRENGVSSRRCPDFIRNIITRGDHRWRM